MWKRFGLFLLCTAATLMAGCSAEGVAHPTNLQPATMPTETSDDETAAYKKTTALLHEPSDLQVDKQGFEKTLNLLFKNSQIQVVVNWTSLQAAGIDRTTPVSINLQHVAHSRILKQILDDVGGGTANLSYTIDNEGIVVVSTRDDLNSEKFQTVRIYHVPAVFGEAELFQDKNTHELIDTIICTVSQDSWRENGGVVGSIFEFDGYLIVKQTRDNQRAIADLLCKLRNAAFDRVHVYDVRDIVANDDKELIKLMDMLESLSSRTTWDDRNGYLAVMRGINGRIFVTGSPRTHEEVAYLLKLIRESKVNGERFNVLTPTGLAHSAPPPPSTEPWHPTFNLSEITGGGTGSAPAKH